MKYIDISLVIGTYTVPDTPEGRRVAKDALLADVRQSVVSSPKRLGWTLRDCFVETENTDGNPRVHAWVIEDLKETLGGE